MAAGTEAECGRKRGTTDFRSEDPAQGLAERKKQLPQQFPTF